ncbi:MAG: hypothetical protein HPY89_07960 [Pelotomaculum sp.]|uniref:Flp pilus assembly protein TadD n=1 Tax=Pelotomaculum thermopropionicum (strain DSM 13744 / JCM 10971 / SI) TaxID=370438 RepID=A5D2B4_PELTS|nr:hypothetical protein [Pelotomaculum sp.]BAF59629.1 flp pilus assembly protein TadD [Pelotomaculum thermopropionicum SI]
MQKIKLLKNLLGNFLNNQNGLAAVMLCAGMAALFGFAALVTDIGLLAAKRQQLINTMDAAALAGAQELPDNPAQAVQVARDYAGKNGFAPDSLNISISGDNRTISVAGREVVNTIFARVLGIYSKTVSAGSSASVQGLTSCQGVAPLTISDKELEGDVFYTLKTLKYGDPSLGPGNFGALSLGGKGADTYRKNLIDGYSGILRVGETVETKPGNMSGPTSGIDERIARCREGCTFNRFTPGCPRIIIIPVHRYDPDLHGRDEVTITGFAAFFVDRSNSARDEIEGYFIKTAGEGEAGPSQPDYGLRAVRLTS